jgi:hypothetical protein
VNSIVRCSISSHNQQGNIGNDIKDYEDNFEQREERVNHHIVGIPRDGEPFALHTEYPISGKYTNHGRENKPGSVYDCTPHEKSLKRINIHNVSPFFVCIQPNMFYWAPCSYEKPRQLTITDPNLHFSVFPVKSLIEVKITAHHVFT